MKIVKIISSGIFVCLFSVKTMAQVDPHFSQYYAYPLWLNPALTGVIDGDYRVSVNAKQQWSGIEDGFLTGGVSFDMAPAKQFSFGATILNQSAGAVNFNYLTALVSGAYRIRFGNQGLNMINFAVQGGVINKSFDASKITTGGQFDPTTGVNPGFPMNESFESSSVLMPDVGAGIMYFDGNPDKRVNTFAGISAAHLNRPADKFFGDRRPMPVRYTAHGGASFNMSSAFRLTPNVLHMRQGNAQETSVGMYAQVALNDETGLMFGSNYRLKDAGIAFLGFNIKNLSIGLSYDVNTSSFQQATNNNGGLELSVSFISRRGITGPNFFCPRL